MEDLNILLDLDDISKNVFDENKYKMIFDDARLKTNEYIILDLNKKIKSNEIKTIFNTFNYDDLLHMNSYGISPEMDKISLDVSQLTNGIYITTVSSYNFTAKQKIVINK